jgi:hypothetical protein
MNQRPKRENALKHAHFRVEQTRCCDHRRGIEYDEILFRMGPEISQPIGKHPCDAWRPFEWKSPLFRRRATLG